MSSKNKRMRIRRRRKKRRRRRRKTRRSEALPTQTTHFLVKLVDV